MGIFKSQKLMRGSVVTTVLCALYLMVRNAIKGNGLDIWSETFCLVLLSAIFAVVIYITYAKHDENAMKPAIGMLLGFIIFQSLQVFCTNVFVSENLDVYLSSGAMGVVSLVLDSLQFLLNLIFCFNHIFISSGHDSSPKQLKLNQVLCIGIVVDYILQVVVSAFVFYPEKVVYLAVFYLLMLCNVVTVLCVESKLDYFRALRADRENG